MFSPHSASSSPDILAPPADADYLISSPFKPFSGRQSSLMSPANLRILQTPGAAKRKRSRINLSPAKSAHSIRFDDIVLPGSPTRKSNGRQRSSSPAKAQPDGNVSPWRIRVTLEATQDENEQASPSRKRNKPSTFTTKIPLKDDSEQTPRKRGRPRKSVALNATPLAGSPGHTPGPVNSEQKRRRGRPRKYQPEPETNEHDTRLEDPEQIEAGVPVSTGTELDRRSWSPLDLAGDADSDDGFDDNQPMDIPFDTPGQMEPPVTDLGPEVHSVGPSFDTPDGDAIDRFHSHQGDDDLHSTPSKMPTPVRDIEALSPENSIHAGHTPMPPRVYPTPASSSQVDDDRQERTQTIQGTATSASKPNERYNGDPTNEHREFDSIMESEGFSMVSLDTLPSARQHALTNEKLAKGPLKPFIEREANGVLRRKTKPLEYIREEASASRSDLDPMPSPEPQPEFSRSRTDRQSSVTKRFSSPAVPIKPVRKPLQLAKLVRTGIALERVLSRSNPAYSPGRPVPDYMRPRQRLELIFSDLDLHSQRLLGAALGLAQVLAIRRRMKEIRSPRRRTLLEEEIQREEASHSPDLPQTSPNVSRTPNSQLDGPTESSPSTEMKRRFAEWQREREAISRTIQMANSSQVIVIDSDASDLRGSDAMDDVDDVDLSPQKLMQNEPLQEDEEYDAGYENINREQDYVADDNDVDDDDGYEDIWQEQAKDEGNSGQRSILEPQDDMESSPWKGASASADREYGRTFSPDYWVNGQSNVPNLGQSHIRKLREQAVDPSILLRAEDTPNRVRYYYGRSSPLSAVKDGSQRAPSSAASQRQRDAKLYEESGEPYELEIEAEHEDYVDFSPEKDLGDDTFQIDPTTRFVNEIRRHHPEFADNASVSDDGGSDISAHEESLTPRNPPLHNDHPGSTWFQKITGLTPGWLKAPNREPSPQHARSSPPQTSAKPPTPIEEYSEEDEEDLQKLQTEDDVRDIEESQPVRKPGPEPQSQSESESHIEQEAPSIPHSNTIHSSPSLSPSPSPPIQRRQQPSPRQQPKPASPQNLQQQPSPKNQPQPQSQAQAKSKTNPLPTSGPFTDNHYSLLRHIYHRAKHSPQLFPPHPGTAHKPIIGDYIWTSDNNYGVPITELQFAIVYRFRRELAALDRKAGGDGRVRWTDAELHRRLVSVIIGEQIREDRAAGEGRESEVGWRRPKSILQRG
ncbi:hypothetical protein BJY04DRAFT_229690 [Aspergillus karnatakaensis]|uniref:putative AT DNA binding protein n=1 Tax=Aspergillus karnatakaensis TaxID=1810916 RepID=UPI003CCD92E2